MNKGDEPKIIFDIAPNPNVEIVYNRASRRVQYCIVDENDEFKCVDKIDSAEGIYKPPTLLQKMAQNNMIRLPEQPEKFSSETDLDVAIYNFLYKYVDYSDEYRKLDVYYAKLTWVYDRLPILPYRRALGDTGRGKTRWATALGSICYKAYTQGAATTAAPIYRTSELIKGTIIIDENYFSKETETGQAIIAILNCGYSKDTGFVVRCVGNNNDPTLFVCYGPKLIAARTPFPDEATENRTLSHFAYETDRPEMPVPIHLNEDFWNESLALRNKLLYWRLKNKDNKITEDVEFENLKINPRLKEVLLPLSTIIEEPEVKVSLRNLAVDLNHTLEEVRSASPEGIVLTAILSLSIENRKLSMGNISERIADINTESQYLTKPKYLGWFCRKRLGLKIERIYDNNKKSNPYTIITDVEKIIKLGKQYGIDEKTITSITTITLEDKGVFKASPKNALQRIPTLSNIKEVIEVIDWIKQNTNQGRDEVSTPILYSFLQKTANGDSNKAMTLLNWLTSEGVVIVNEQNFKFNLVHTVFLEAHIQRESINMEGI